MRKKILLAISVLSLITFSNTNIQKSQNRINQIDRQVKNNNAKISKNQDKISDAKREEQETKREIAALNEVINKVQFEYNKIEKEYIDLLKKIGKSDQEIKNSIRKINESVQKITEGKNEYSNKIKLWNRVINARVFNDRNFSAKSVKKSNDLKKILDRDEENIHKIEKYKLKVEKDKKNEEIIKSKKEQEAKIVDKKKKELEIKRAELRKNKKSMDNLVYKLQKIQDTLKNENKKIEKTNSNLIAERRRLERQISQIIANANKQKNEAQKSGTAVVVPKGTGQFMMPINGPIVIAYGQEKAQGLSSKGIEIRGSYGQSVKASDSGVVMYSGSLKGLGAVIMIDHGDFITVYGNLASVRVANRAKVTKGQTIGTLGKDSVTKEPNLYFEVRKGVNYVNPANYL